jgi:hypothetical protein
MNDEKTHSEQGQIERARRLRRLVENLRDDEGGEDTSLADKSLKEQIEARARAAAQRQATPDSE